jgi:hypothetical protein
MGSIALLVMFAFGILGRRIARAESTTPIHPSPLVPRHDAITGEQAFLPPDHNIPALLAVLHGSPGTPCAVSAPIQL